MRQPWRRVLTFKIHKSSQSLLRRIHVLNMIYLHKIIIWETLKKWLLCIKYTFKRSLKRPRSNYRKKGWGWTQGIRHRSWAPHSHIKTVYSTRRSRRIHLLRHLVAAGTKVVYNIIHKGFRRSDKRILGHLRCIIITIWHKILLSWEGWQTKSKTHCLSSLI